jgi:hypothetical protein
MSTKPSTGRRARKGGYEVDVFDHRREEDPRAGVAKYAKRRANRRARRAGRRTGWAE